MPHIFTRETLDGFALALAEQWEAIGETPRWPFDALGPLGGDQCAAFIGRRFGNWSHQRTMQGIDHLVRIGSDDAIYELITLSFARSALRSRRSAAANALDIVAKQRGVPDRDALIVSVYPKKGSARVSETQRTWLEYLMLAG